MIKVGIIGLGFIGTTVGPEIDGAEGATVVALSDINPDRLQEVGEMYEIAEEARYGSYDEMYENEDLDAVLIATPHTLHYEHVSKALERDLHVLCEKPLTTDLNEAKSLISLADGSEGTLTVGYQRRLDPAFIRAREHVNRHLSGVNFVTAEVTQDWIANQRGKWRADPELSGGGQLYDTGSHLLDIVLWVTGIQPRHVTAEMVFDDEAERVDRHATLNVVTEEGEAAVSISVSGDTPETREHIHIWGEEGAIYLDGAGWGPRDLKTIGLPELEMPEPEATTKGEAFVESIGTEKPPFATAREALTVTALTEAAYESARTGERTAVEAEETISKPRT